MFLIFISVFFIVYGSASYYVGLRFFQSFEGAVAGYPVLYWSLFALIALSPMAARMAGSVLRGRVPEVFVRLGDYWMAAIYYLVAAWVLVDVLRLVGRFLAPQLVGRLAPSAPIASGILLALTLLLTYGSLNAAYTKVQHYEINLNKAAPGLHSLRAVMLSDVHLGTTVNATRLGKLVAQINDLHPDVVFLVGDIIDGDVQLSIEQEMDKLLSQISVPLGVFGVLGNHEYLGGSGELAASHLGEAGVQVLRDSYTKVNDLLYVVGREDRMASRFTGQKRLDLSVIMAGMDKKLPIILMDHQPYGLVEAQENGVDLQLSGHTHHGQFFPNDFITGRIFEVDWGYLRKGDMQVIVSCGYGTWGPPIRIGSHSEIVVIDIKFAKD